MVENTLNSFLLLKPGAIGDLLQITPVIRQLKKSFPSAAISILVSSEATRSLFLNNPHIDKIFVYDKKNQHKKLGDFLHLVREISSLKYDVILNFQRSNLRLWLLILLLNPKRVLVYNKDESKQAVINHLETLERLHIPVDYRDLSLELFIDKEAELFAENLFLQQILDDKRVIALNLGASHKVNRWPIRHFARLAELIESDIGAKCLIVGGEDDVPLAEELLKITNLSLINLTGKLNLLQLGAVLKKCDVMVTGDTGPMHIASAVGTKIVALFGAADPKRTGPVGSGHVVLQAKKVSCLPCRKRVCNNKKYLECMEKITPEEVLENIKKIILEENN